MEKLVFADGDQIGVFDGETVTRYESDYIRRYKEYAETRTRNDEWKYMGEGARFRGDYDTYRARIQPTRAYINGVAWDGDGVIYAFTADGSSGVLRKNLASEKKEEAHIFTSAESEIKTVDRGGALLAVTVSEDNLTSDIGTLNVATSELHTLTGGDSRDKNASFSVSKRNVVLFDSAGVGRTQSGEFTGKYAPAAIMSLSLDSMEIKEIKRSDKYSYTKPKEDESGTIYCIRRPNKAKRGNPLLEILLIPVRIVQAIVMFLQAFVVMFTGKSLTSAGDNPAKGRDVDGKKLFIDGNLIDAEKEYKRNKRYKDREYGFIPASWKLVKLVGEKEEELKGGVCDFALTRDGGIYFTDGKHIYYLFEGKTQKITETEQCFALATENFNQNVEDLFSI